MRRLRPLVGVGPLGRAGELHPQQQPPVHGWCKHPVPFTREVDAGQAKGLYAALRTKMREAYLGKVLGLITEKRISLS